MRRLVTLSMVLFQLTAVAVSGVNGVAAQAPAQKVATFQIAAAVPRTSKEVFGYALASSLANTEWGYPSWNFTLLTTVAYFGVHVDATGVLVDDSGWQTWNSPVETAFVSTAHAAGTRVLMTIVLQDFSPGTPAMCSGLANRATTVLQAARAMNARGADGISVDYEGLNGTCANGQTARAMMVDFVRQLRSAIGTTRHLSVATYGSAASDPTGFFDVGAMAPYVDSFFVMAYDLEYSNYWRPPISCASFCLGPTAPLGAYYWNDSVVVSQYEAVVPASKVILGVPYYGRKACVASAVPNSLTTTAAVADTYLDALSEAGDPSVRAGSYAVHRDVRDSGGSVRWDTWYNTSLQCTRELYFDDATSLGRKYDLVNQSGVRGVGIWTLNYGGGAPELWNAIASHFSACTGASTATAVPSPQPVGAKVVINASAATCAHPLFAFWMLPPGGAWSLLQPYSPASSFTWSTAGAVAGVYRFSVWARDASGLGLLGTAPNTYDAFAALNVTLTPTCAATTAQAQPAIAAAIGTVVTITPATTGCPNPRYEFWLLPPNGSWTDVQPYSTSAGYSWNTAGRPAGAYRFSVWTRDATSPNQYDTFAAFAYTLKVVPCTGVSVSIAPAASAPVGTGLAITANAAGCPNPLYEVWVLPPGGSWSIARGYSTSAAFAWPTAGRQAGQYRFSVWARDLSSPGGSGAAPYTYDAFAAAAYTLTPVCSSVNASSFPVGTAGVGNTITITAKASGCPAPRYEFWILPPGGTWTLVQAYSANAVLKWPTAGKSRGTYRVSVWARDGSSPGTTGAAPNTYDAFSAFSYVLV